MKPRKPTKSNAVAPVPKLKKDGTPWTPWSEEVALRLQKKAEKIAAGVVLPEGRKCAAHTTGIHGPKRPCDRWAMDGQTTCYVHGGNTKGAKEVAKRRFIEELEPSINRLTELRDQSEHMPTALGAANQLINRVLGKVGESDKANTSNAPIIKIGIGIGGLPKNGQHNGQTPVAVAVQVEQPQLPESTIDADVEDE